MPSSKQGRAGLAPIHGTEIYFEAGGMGKPLLLLHAGVADSRMWDPQVEEFSKPRFVIRCDLRGFGRSAIAPGMFSHHEDVVALLRYLEIDRVEVIGASFGGAVALSLALAHPEMVTALVLVDPALGGYEFESAEVQAFFAAEESALARGDPVAATELNLKMWVDGDRRDAGEVQGTVRELVREMQLNNCSRPAVSDAIEIDLQPPAMDQLDRITVPTLVLVGEHDVAEFRHIAKLIAGKIPGARHEIIPGTAHLPSMEEPEQFNRIVLAFLG